MPRLKESQIPMSVRAPGELRRQLEGLGYELSHSSIELFTKDGHDIFIVASQSENGNLEVSQVTFPSALNEDLSEVLNVPFSSSNRMPGEEGA